MIKASIIPVVVEGIFILAAHYYYCTSFCIGLELLSNSTQVETKACGIDAVLSGNL